MKQKDVKIGGIYQAKVSGNLVDVKVKSVSTLGGWIGVNLKTGYEIRIRTAARLRSKTGG